MLPIRLALLVLLSTLAACAGAPSTSSSAGTTAVPTLTPEQRLAAMNVAVTAAIGADDRELAVQPLRDPQVEDLRAAADAALARRDYASAGDALNQALMIVADDPAILQERAEVALLQADYERAETLAKRGFDLGSKVGPLCRRHWATIEQARLARGLREDAASAHAQIESCTVAGFNRM